ncbi:hypothetical protein EYR41_009936 [Orbilia oligospora]|uniref:Alpha-1,3-glucanase/mutanase n=1 Tax=Orbilia oligospora TaxID=2813651 RepID=A0A8H2DSN5_ORBOL|nr:hypothetical protein EYR41_009936 [Orbilia oligospora]
MRIASYLLLAAATIGNLVGAVPATDIQLEKRQTTDRLVFAHFMIGIVSNRGSPADFDDDMKRAKALGIDAFALNIGVDPYTDAQLNLAYQSAANNGMKVFISFDFNWYHTNQAVEVANKIKQYMNLPAQLYVENKVFVSSFAGDGLDVPALRANVGKEIFFAPNFHPEMGTNFGTIDGALNWMAWPNNGNNKAPTVGRHVSVQEGDQAYIRALAGKPYIAPVSPWFFCHFGPEVPYSKNWVFPSDLLWYDRWVEILTLGPRFIEVVTWNDYGEAHYIGPLSSSHTDDGSSKYVNDLPHGGWMDMAKPFIAAYKAGATSVDSFIQDEQVVYWYRPTPRALNCDATDTCMVTADNSSGNYFMGRPNGWETMEDSVFVVSLLKSPATLIINSGNNQKVFNAPAGTSSYTVPMGVGAQSFLLARNNQVVFAGTSSKDIIDTCVCGIYNFNPYVGAIPPLPYDSLNPPSLGNFVNGLKVQTCQPVPSLGSTTRPPPTLPATFTTPSTSSRAMTTGSPTPRTTTNTTSTPTYSSTTIGGSVCDIITTTTTITALQTSTRTVTVMGTSRTTTIATTTTSASNPQGTTCTAGMGSGNYAGLCSFCCSYGYCPPGPCTCSAWGVPPQAPPASGYDGKPAPGLDDSYLGLCSFACSHGYCPSTACARV